MITVKLPDGNTAQFPDGTPPETIKSAIQKKLGGKAGPFATASAASQRLTGMVAPMTEGVLPSENVQVQQPTPQQSYDKSLTAIRQKYYPWADDSKWQEIISRPGWAPRTAGELFDPTMGLSDEARGLSGALGNLLSGQNPIEGFQDFQGFEQARRELGREQAGALGTVAEIGGALASGRPDMAAGRVAGLWPSVFKGATDAAKQGAVYGFASTEGDLVERARGAVKGGAFAAPFGAAVPLIAAGARKVLSPIRAPAAKQRAAQVLAREGVELTAGQATGSKRLQFREAELGGMAADDFMERQADQFTSAALRRVGVQANRATPDVIDNALDTIGQQFDDLALRNGLKTDPRFVQDLQRAWRHFDDVTNASTRPPFVQRILDDIGSRLQTGYAFLDGEWFKATRSELNRVMRSTSNPEMKEAIRGIVSAFDDAMERTLQQVNPADLGAWREARRLYRNMFVIEDAATRAGEKAADGIITPHALRGAAIKQNRRAFARGMNEFTDLANAGASTMTPLPNSGTPGRIGAKFLLPAGAGTGAYIGGMLGNVPGAIAGGAIGAALPWAVGRGILSGPGRAYLGNQLAAGPVTGVASGVGALLGRGAQPLLPRP